MKKRVIQIVIFLGILLLIIPLTFAGFSDWIKELTGKATSGPVDLNISVGAGTAPTIPFVDNSTTTALASINEGPASTPITINFTAYDAEGFGNLNVSSAVVNVSKAGETTRENTTCQHVVDYNTNYANYSCNITFWWYDGAGTWDITAFIGDMSGTTVTNSTQTVQVATSDAFYMNPSSLTWAEISAGTTDQEAVENITLNNSGNVEKYIEVNTTDLKGETNNAYALYAGNFSVKNVVGCGGTPMVYHTFENITSAILPAGNYTINDESTGQEVIFVCLEEAGSELIQQAYSTNEEGSWTVKIVTST